ncbi:hypothetical protein M231_05315 [Tremella mesenterica]|uniref:DUF5745 domain-containing protein n=1 Tax=Tremella mesenterica TaxID=5217 RepID=A0A4Q1BID5_TREME|nr:hypothetical protein M231_05315 [Tremella mesenterica]
MPTQPLPLLHALLRALDIPVYPRTLSSTSPSLLLLILETLLDTRLALPDESRECKTRQDEITIVKCILGVLADDVLGIDLTIINPIRVVQGSESELAVVVMAFAVLAKRSGLILHIKDRSREEEETEELDWSAELGTMPTTSSLPEPISPDTSFSPLLPSVGKIHNDESFDVFGSLGRKSRRGLTPREGGGVKKGMESDDLVDFDPTLRTMSESRGDEGGRRHTRGDHVMQGGRPKESIQSSTSASSNIEGRKTVLQHMMDEFGLGWET